MRQTGLFDRTKKYSGRYDSRRVGRKTKQDGAEQGYTEFCFDTQLFGATKPRPSGTPCEDYGLNNYSGCGACFTPDKDA